jgi:S1-C subfamily serine protease
MNFIDVIIILLMLVAAVRGVDVGFVRQFGSLAGLWLGLAIGGVVVSSFSMNSTVAILTIITSIVTGVILGEVAGVKLKEVFHEHKVNIVDRICGAAMGIVTCLVAIWLGSTLVSIVSSPMLQRSIRDSAIIGYLDRSLPPATDAIASLETYLSNAGLQDVIKTTEPKLGSDTSPLPNITTFANVITTTKPSIVEVEGRSCSGIDVGSGFLVDTNLVVTNAHVVAGMRTPFVRDSNRRYPAKIVAFDSNLDIAVLQVEDLSGQPLPTRLDLAAKNTAGLVAGYPGGGDFVASPALIADTYIAVGSDIYNENKTSRKIYVLRADIQKGNSGGPLLNEAGEVIGVVFARSTTYDKVGYALTMPNVLKVIEQAKSNPNPGTSLRCL